ncbi:MAG: DnaA regulatory inactivator Hda [Burkholderiales bacterium]
MKQLALHLSAPPAPSIENFVAGRNAELLQTLVDLVSADRRERFVYLWGQPRCGKSHLLRALVDSTERAGLSSAYIPGAACDSVDIVGENRVLAIDDVHRLDDRGQNALFNLYNELRAGNGVLVTSGATAPAQLGLRPDVVTRLGWGLVYQLHPLSDEDKTKALASRALERGFRLPQEVGDYLLTHWRRDLPSLLEMVDALDRFSLENQRAITLPLLKKLLETLATPR